jgi:glutathione synthase
LKFLLITNINSHVETESFYPLVSEIQKKSDEIYIIDQGVEENISFFNVVNGAFPFIYKVEEENFNFHLYKKSHKNTYKIINIDVDVVLLRVDRPVSDSFLKFIDTFFAKSIVINSPKGIIETSSKEYLFNFKEYCPEMKLCFSLEDVIDFSSMFPIVVKPLKGFGGKGIIRILEGKIHYENKEISHNEFCQVINDLLNSEKKCLAVRYLKNIKMGDKRILVVNRKIIGAFNRVPRKNSWLANVSQGAISEKTTINRKEREIANKLSDDLESKGIVIFGFDLIKGDDDEELLLSEINTLNVGGFYQLNELFEEEHIVKLVNNLYNFIAQKKLTIAST